MVGGGNRKDGGSMVMNNTNVFAALETLKKKKKSDKDKTKNVVVNPAPQVYWAPAPLTVEKWADVDDDDDDDYFATTAPPQSVWSTSEQDKIGRKSDTVEESESEDDMLGEADDDVEEELDHEPEIHVEPVSKKPDETPAPPKEPERQLSKKERKKKELEELDAIIADFKVDQEPNNGQDESHDVVEGKKEVNPEKDGEEVIPVESKAAKKKKKKSSSKATQIQASDSDSTNVQNGQVGTSQTEEEASTVDMKERLKKIASMKKKKSNKELDPAARAAAIEAAARNAKLAAGKKKEKSHYNQQPIR